MKFTQTFLLFCVPVLMFSQYKPLEHIDLESEEYSILATFSESDPSSLQDSLGEFYIDEIQVLKELKEQWTFEQEAPFYACGYHYRVSICSSGKSIGGFSVNLNCNTICAEGNCYNFDNDKLRLLFGKTNSIFTKQFKCSIEEGRRYIESIQNDSNLIYAPYPLWMTYEGDFEFTYNYPRETEKYYSDFHDIIDSGLLKYSSDSVLAKLKIEIETAYPHEKFELDDYGGSLTSIFVRVTSYESLEKKFNLYERNDYGQTWEAFKPSIRTFWKHKPAATIKSYIEDTKQENIAKSDPIKIKSPWLILFTLISIISAGIILKYLNPNKT